MIRLAQLYTGGVGSEIVRRLDGHRSLELVAVLVHAEEKVGIDAGELVGGTANGIVTTQSVADVLAARPNAAIYSGMRWDVELIARLLRAGVNVYTGLGGYFLPGQPEFDELDAAGKEGNASFAAGGTSPDSSVMSSRFSFLVIPLEFVQSGPGSATMCPHIPRRTRLGRALVSDWHPPLKSRSRLSTARGCGPCVNRQTW